MAGFREFVTGEVLTAANVDDFLAKQAVMKFADAAARDAALGTAVASGNALREGMVAWLDDDDSVIAYDGTAWNPIGGGFDDVEVITATDATWPVPSLASPIVRVTVIGGGGGGGAGAQTGATDGATGGTTTFNAGSAGTVTATGGLGGRRAASASTLTTNGTDGLASSNGGQGGVNVALNAAHGSGKSGNGGTITVAYLDLDGITTVNVTIGAGGTAGTPDANGWPPGVGGRGEVIVEYKAA
jgi:hypothetical protein